MYTVTYNEFQNMDRGGSIIKHITRRTQKSAKETALTISKKVMVPGLVRVTDKHGKQIASYQQGKTGTVLFGG